ncbi:hypothetical protein AAMO2058_000823700 [Amorphochlora amoebiformis]
MASGFGHAWRLLRPRAEKVGNRSGMENYFEDELRNLDKRDRKPVTKDEREFQDGASSGKLEYDHSDFLAFSHPIGERYYELKAEVRRLRNELVFAKKRVWDAETKSRVAELRAPQMSPGIPRPLSRCNVTLLSDSKEGVRCSKCRAPKPEEIPIDPLRKAVMQLDMLEANAQASRFNKFRHNPIVSASPSTTQNVPKNETVPASARETRSDPQTKRSTAKRRRLRHVAANTTNRLRQLKSTSIHLKDEVRILSRDATRQFSFAREQIALLDAELKKLVAARENTLKRVESSQNTVETLRAKLKDKKEELRMLSASYDAEREHRLSIAKRFVESTEALKLLQRGKSLMQQQTKALFDENTRLSQRVNELETLMQRQESDSTGFTIQIVDEVIERIRRSGSVR